MSKTITLNAKPAAILLAEQLVEKRRTGWHPLTGDVRAGFYMAALAHGYGGPQGVDPRQGGYAGCRAKPHGVDAQAGWLVFVMEGWNTTKPSTATPQPVTRRQMRRRAQKRKESRHAAA